MTKAKPETSAKKRHEEFAEQIIARLGKGLAPWQRPWEAGAAYPPFNPVSGTVYSGLNNVMLSLYGYADPRWMTFKQANGQGYRIRKGEKSQPIVHWQWTETIDKRDDDGNLMLDAEGKPEKEVVRLERPRVRFFSVFHASQLEMENGQPIPPFESKELEWRPNERAEAILQASGANIIHDQRDRAFYAIQKDEIHLPPKESFGDEGQYYPIALHELSHWTRHPSRLNRENGPFGSESYAREELRAHISSWMLSQDLGLAFNPDHQAAYLQSWVKVLKDDPYEIFRACSDAERIKQYVLGLEQKQAAEIIFTDLEQESGSGKWYDDLRRPDDFEYLHKEFVSLEPGATPEQINKLTQVYKAFSGHIAKIVTDELGPDKVLERSRARLTDLLLETHLIHGKMIELGQLPPDSRFPHQELAEGILACEKRIGSDRASNNNDKGVPAEPARETVYLQVPYKEKNEAKKAGARWDRDKKLWYAPVGADLAKLARFLPEKEPAPVQTVSPAEEFRQVLESNGFVLKGDPIMDGKIHRVSIAGKPNQRDGAYQAYADGVPNGWFQNHQTGEATKWVYSGQRLTAEQKKLMQAEMDQRREQAAKEREAQYDKAAERAWEKLAACAGIPVDPEHPYLKSKGVRSHGLFQDQDGNLLAPGIDLDKSHFLNNNPKATAAPRSAVELTLHNHIQTMQTISPDGQKRFESGSKKTGAMFLIGDEQFRQIYFDQKQPQSLFQDLEAKPEILLAEGFATGASLFKATGLPVAVAFDAGNLKPVAEALRRKFPKADLTICADNDHPLVLKAIKSKLGEVQVTPELEKEYAAHNKGVLKAGEAARAVDGRVIVPQFTDEEKAKGLTDFNDLAQSQGVYAVTRLVHPRHREQAAVIAHQARADRPASSLGLAM